MKTTNDWVESKKGVMNGKVVIKGTRIPVDRILYLVASGYTWDRLKEEYPQLREIFLKINKGKWDILDL